MANRSKRTDTRENTFLEVLRQTCNVTEAARAAGVGRRTAYEWRDADATFAAAWSNAEQEAADALEREAWRRGVDGIDKPVTYQGEITATYKEYSDRMLEMLLKAHRPEKFKDRVSNEHSGPDGRPIQHELNVEELAQSIESKLARITEQGRQG